MDANDVLGVIERALLGRRMCDSKVGFTQIHTAHLAVTLDDVEALDDVTVLYEGITAEPAIPGLEYAVLRLYGEEFEALSDGINTTITMGSVPT